MWLPLKIDTTLFCDDTSMIGPPADLVQNSFIRKKGTTQPHEMGYPYALQKTTHEETLKNKLMPNNKREVPIVRRIWRFHYVSRRCFYEKKNSMSKQKAMKLPRMMPSRLFLALMRFMSELRPGTWLAAPVMRRLMLASVSRWKPKFSLTA